MSRYVPTRARRPGSSFFRSVHGSNCHALSSFKFEYLPLSPTQFSGFEIALQAARVRLRLRGSAPQWKSPILLPPMIFVRRYEYHRLSQSRHSTFARILPRSPLPVAQHPQTSLTLTHRMAMRQSPTTIVLFSLKTASSLMFIPNWLFVSFGLLLATFSDY